MLDFDPKSYARLKVPCVSTKVVALLKAPTYL